MRRKAVCLLARTSKMVLNGDHFFGSCWIFVQIFRACYVVPSTLLLLPLLEHSSSRRCLLHLSHGCYHPWLVCLCELLKLEAWVFPRFPPALMGNPARRSRQLTVVEGSLHARDAPRVLPVSFNLISTAPGEAGNNVLPNLRCQMKAQRAINLVLQPTCGRARVGSRAEWLQSPLCCPASVTIGCPALGQRCPEAQ